MNECCKKEENRKVIAKTEDRVALECQVCKCKHYEMEVDAGRFFSQGASA